jgi:hypothetical protein
LLSAAVIGCFSWELPETEHWIGPASWYASLVLSVSAILLASSMGWIFNTIAKSPKPPCLEKELAMILKVPPRRTGADDDDTREKGWLPKSIKARQAEIRWNMIFTWQAPMMLMAYSVMAFFVGLTVYVCTPLYDGGGWVKESNVRRANHQTCLTPLTLQCAIFYLVSCGLTGSIFVWCAFWAYRFVNIEQP